MSIIYSLCDRSMTALKPWAEVGWPCVAIDIMAPLVEPPPGVRHIQMDLRKVESLPDASFVLGWPPCTHLARSGARWWPTKGQKALDEALELVNTVRRLAGSTPLIIENPVGRLTRHWRKPDRIVEPHHFAGYTGVQDAYQKATCLWLENGALPPIESRWKGEIDKRRIHWAAPGPQRAMVRSMTPRGLAIGVFLANSAVLGLPNS